MILHVPEVWSGWPGCGYLRPVVLGCACLMLLLCAGSGSLLAWGLPGTEKGALLGHLASMLSKASLLPSVVNSIRLSTFSRGFCICIFLENY